VQIIQSTWNGEESRDTPVPVQYHDAGKGHFGSKIKKQIKPLAETAEKN
jgi:hypothetical protein